MKHSRNLWLWRIWVLATRKTNYADVQPLKRENYSRASQTQQVPYKQPWKVKEKMSKEKQIRTRYTILC